MNNILRLHTWLGISGAGSLLAALVGPMFVSSFWLENRWRAQVGMNSGFEVSSSLLRWSDDGWVVGPLIGCLVSTVCYVGISLATGDRQVQQPGSA